MWLTMLFLQLAFTIASFTARWEITDFLSQSTDFSFRKLIKSTWSIKTFSELLHWVCLYQLTSVSVSSNVKPVGVLNKVVGFRFLGAIIKLAHMKRDDEIKILASIVCTTSNQAGMRKLYRHCLVDMSLQHPAKDRFVESSSTVALLRVNCVEHTRQTQKNREAKELSHHPKLSALCVMFLKKKTRLLNESSGGYAEIRKWIKNHLTSKGKAVLGSWSQIIWN